MPALAKPRKKYKLLKDFLELSRERGVNFETLDIAKEVMIRESTIRRRWKRFSDQEMILLAKELLACRNPYTCPKGRPTFFEIPTRDFEKRFQRKI